MATIDLLGNAGLAALLSSTGAGAVAGAAALAKLKGEEGAFFDFKARSLAINDLTNAKTLLGRPHDLIPITRASTAAYVDRDRKLKFGAANTMRYHHDPATAEPRGWLIEGACSNGCLQSEDLNTTWSGSNTSITVNTAAGPEGTTVLDKIVATAINNFHTRVQVVSGTNNAGYQCVSAFVRAAEFSKGSLSLYESPTFTRVFGVSFDLVAGTMGTPFVSGGASNALTGIENWGGGLFRIWVSGLLGGTDTATQIRFTMTDNASAQSFLGDTTSGFHAGCVQLEPTLEPTSYIKTTTVAVARSADTNATLLSLFPFNPLEGTLYVKARLLNRYMGALATGCPLQLIGAASNYLSNRFVVTTPTTAAYLDFIGVFTGTIADTGNAAVTAGATIRQCVGWRENDVEVSVNGAVVSTDTSFSPLPTVANVNFGGQTNTSSPATNGMEMLIEEAAILTRRFTTAELNAFFA